MIKRKDGLSPQVKASTFSRQRPLSTKAEQIETRQSKGFIIGKSKQSIPPILEKKRSKCSTIANEIKCSTIAKIKTKKSKKTVKKSVQTLFHQHLTDGVSQHVATVRTSKKIIIRTYYVTPALERRRREGGARARLCVCDNGTGDIHTQNSELVRDPVVLNCRFFRRRSKTNVGYPYAWVSTATTPFWHRRSVRTKKNDQQKDAVQQ